MPRYWLILALSAPLGAQLAPANLRCEYLRNPMGVDVRQPRLSWVLEHQARAQAQTAYQVLVSSKPDASAGDEWDSGKTASPQSTQVVYAGKSLQSGRTYYWKVRYWDKDGKPSPFSPVARFDTGLFDRAGWHGRWIGGAHQLRTEFTLAARPLRARVYLCGLGYSELWINGRRVGRRVLDPAWTTYEKRVLYSTYDVTDLLQPGANALGVMLGEGWFQSRALLLQLNVELEGGRKTEVVSDGSWKGAAGPIVSDSVYDGEVYDARRETPGWTRPGFDAGEWQPAAVVQAPAGVLSAEMMPPIRKVDTLVPLRLTSPRPGVYVYDMGQNFSGWVELRVRGPRGARVRLRHAELLYDNGMLNVENLRKAKATDEYILKGGEEEVWEPRFTYHGFRYVELTGFPGAPKLDTIRGKVVHSDVRPAGGFIASSQILNQIQRLILWGITSNLESVPTDCNQRDERMGWMADAHLYAESAMWNFDMPAFYTNFLRDIRDIQRPDGTVTDTVPHRYGRRPADPAWGAAYPLIAWYMYEHYGDRRILAEHFDGIKAWTDYERTRARDGILSYSYYGDWVPIEKTPGDLVSTFYYYWDAALTARIAEILGKSAEASTYRQLADEIQAAFNRRFLNPQTGLYGTGTQTAQILPLFLNLVPQDQRGRVLSALRDNLVYTHNTHLTTGILGTKYLMPLLTRSGHADLAYELATQTTYPSWGYMVEHGATTLWELWQNKTGPSMNSHNHPMFGSVGAWFYTALAGINPDPEKPGFEHVVIAPQVVRDLEWASGTEETIRGTVSCSWRRGDHSLRIEVTIPVGSTAEVHIPKLGMSDVRLTESGNPVSGAKETEQDLVVPVGSGSYTFELTGS
ncbi:MAG TPA: family 78 glycoside hydrolase catalytic domain [Bryobacteraceae bacterium]|nr:family 78 glycoside hydrolase catalytic domain [Bryobacteraceae bacterium]